MTLLTMTVVVDIMRVSRQARELLLIAMLLLEMEMVIIDILVILMKIRKFWSDYGAGGDFLGVDLVESIDKGSIFRHDYSTNR